MAETGEGTNVGRLTIGVPRAHVFGLRGRAVMRSIPARRFRVAQLANPHYSSPHAIMWAGHALHESLVVCACLTWSRQGSNPAIVFANSLCRMAHTVDHISIMGQHV